jgi:hypothetical protein
MSRARRLALVLAGAALFGLAAAWAKDPGSNGIGTLSILRADLGNLSAPWLLVAFVAGSQGRRLRTGALLGVVATLVALAAFYAYTTAVVDLGGHGLLGDVRLELVGNRLYFVGGLASGPLFGIVGAWWRRRPSVRASALAGALMLGEPLVTASQVVPVWGLSPQHSTISLGVYATEFVLGVALLVAQPARRASSSST